MLAAVERMFPCGDFALFDHTHEGLAEGSWSIAYEGDYDWPMDVSERQFLHPEEFPREVFLEPIAGWCLGVYAAS